MTNPVSQKLRSTPIPPRAIADAAGLGGSPSKPVRMAPASRLEPFRAMRTRVLACALVGGALSACGGRTVVGATGASSDDAGTSPDNCEGGCPNAAIMRATSSCSTSCPRRVPTTPASAATWFLPSRVASRGRVDTALAEAALRRRHGLAATCPLELVRVVSSRRSRYQRATRSPPKDRTGRPRSSPPRTGCRPYRTHRPHHPSASTVAMRTPHPGMPTSRRPARRFRLPRHLRRRSPCDSSSRCSCWARRSRSFHSGRAWSRLRWRYRWAGPRRTCRSGWDPSKAVPSRAASGTSTTRNAMCRTHIGNRNPCYGM